MHATQDAGKPSWIQFTMDGTVFAYLAAICLGTGILFGLAPALHVVEDRRQRDPERGRPFGLGRHSRSPLVGRARSSASSRSTLALLAGAGFMMRNFLTLYRMDLGVETSHLLTMSLALPERKYPALEQRLAFYQRLQERLRANQPVPGGDRREQRAHAGRLRAAARPSKDARSPPASSRRR